MTHPSAQTVLSGGLGRRQLRACLSSRFAAARGDMQRLKGPAKCAANGSE